MTVGKIPSGQFPTGLTDNVFNTNRDQITAAILARITDIMATDGGVVIDSTAETDLQVVDAGGGVVNIKAGVGYDKFGQRLYLSADDSASGLYVGTVNISGTLDLSTNFLVKIDIDNDGAVEIDCQGATPAATTIDEIVAAINAAGFGTIAYRVDSVGNPIAAGTYILVKSSTTGGSSEVEFVAPSATDATNEIFGLSEGAYPHTYNGGGGYAIPDSSGATPYDVIIEYLSVESNVGNFEGGYPTGSDTELTQRDDSYVVTVQLSSVGAINDADQHELWLAQVTNDGGTLTILDKRGEIMLRLKGQRQVDITPPPAPVLVSLLYEAISGTGSGGIANTGNIIPRWEAVTDASGIREYIIQLVLTERDGTAVANADPQEYTLQGFDSTASELQMKIELPLGNKYQVYVAAKDNSLSQNVSPFTDLGNIQVGSVAADDAAVMPSITAASITNGVAVDWPTIEEAIHSYEYCYAVGGGTPDWAGPNTQNTINSEFIVSAAPGIEVAVRVRIRRKNQTLSNEVQAQSVAGGSVIGDNEKVFPVLDIAVLNTDDGKAARFQRNQFLPQPATIKKLVVDVKTLTLNDSDVGMVRIYRNNQEAGFVAITFTETGQHEIEITDKAIFTSGIVICDCYDSAESGSNQAAFTADLFVVYAEGVVLIPPKFLSPKL